MGDRVTIQIIDNSDDFSPLIYGHWCGDITPETIRRAAPMMRKGDISYGFARLLGAFHTATDPTQGLSLGVWNATEIQTSDEQGDNGHFQINIDTGEVRHFGGYSGPMEPIELGLF